MSNHIFNFHDLVLSFCVLEAMLLMLVIVASRQTSGQAKLILASFLGVLAISSLGTLFVWNHYLSGNPYIDAIVVPLFVVSLTLRGPLLYLYMRTVMFSKRPFRRIDLLYLMPALAVFLYFLILPIDIQGLRMQHVDALRQSYHRWLWNFIKYLTLTYTLVACYRVARYRKQLVTFFSDINLLEARLLYILAFGFLVTWSWGTVIHFVGEYSSLPIYVVDQLGLVSNYLAWLVITILCVFCINYQQTAQQVSVDVGEGGSLNFADADIAKIVATMEQQQLFLVPRLSLETFSEKAGFSSKTVSLIINRQFSCNFYEYVNGYRFVFAKKLLEKPESEQSILDILLASGFNSTSSFHRYFKTKEGMSPRDYRKKFRKAPHC